MAASVREAQRGAGAGAGEGGHGGALSTAAALAGDMDFLSEFGYQQKPRRSSLTMVESLEVNKGFFHEWGFDSKEDALQSFGAAERLIGVEVGSEALKSLEAAERLMSWCSSSVDGGGGHDKQGPLGSST